ncbi:MAG: hypothetical protein QNK52_05865 [Porticoccaceae bacterium]
MNKNLSRKVVLSLAALFLVSGCDQSQQASPTVKSEASKFTIAANQKFADNLDLDHQQDFEDARR